MITLLHFKLSSTRLYFFFLYNYIRFYWKVYSQMLFVCLSVFFFRTNENCAILGINKNTSPKISPHEQKKIIAHSVSMFFFRTNENCAILGINENISPKIIRPRTKKYTSLTEWVEYRRGGWKITKQEKNRALKLLGPIGDKPPRLKKC